MYLYHYSMRQLPFSLTPDTELYVPIETHVNAFNAVKFAIDSGEAFCKVIGEVGTGKTMVCRKVINYLQGRRYFAYIPNSKLDARELRFAIAKELGLRLNTQCRDDQLVNAIEKRLIKLNHQHGPVVVLIDEAQALSDDALEALRLFSNIETEKKKLLQIVLFAQPELDERLKKKHLRQLRQRIVFSDHIKPLNWYQTHHYINRRLDRVCNSKKLSVSWLASGVVQYYTRGIPRLVNVVCHKALLLGYGRKQKSLTLGNLIRAISDTESINAFWLRHWYWLLASFALLVSSAAAAYWHLGA